MGKCFGTGVTIKPILSMDVLNKLSEELSKKYNKNKFIYSSLGYSQTNIQIGENIDQDLLFDDIKSALKVLKFDVVERKDKNKRFLLIK